MRLNEALQYSFGDVRDRIGRAVTDLDAEALAWRADEEANTIAWLVWHLARVEDSHIAQVAGRAEVWDDNWARRLGLPPGYSDTGYGHSAEQVGQVRPEREPLLGYVDAVAQMVRAYLSGATDAEFERVVDSSYDPPVTAGVRCMSVLGDALQHVGQAAYVRGLLERSAQ